MRPTKPPALDGVSFAVPPGGRVAIVGPNGSGKSTVVNLLLRFWDYDQGSIRIDGQELHAYRADDVRELIGVVPQHTHLFNATVGDNLYLANPEASQDELIAACQQAQLHEFIQGLPQGYDTLIGENGQLLSGGERQRLAIARAILKNAPILILDEATSQLDALTEQRLMESLEPFMAGRTTLIISHRRAGFERVDQVIALEDGRIVAARTCQSRNRKLPPGHSMPKSNAPECPNKFGVRMHTGLLDLSSRHSHPSRCRPARSAAA